MPAIEPVGERDCFGIVAVIVEPAVDGKALAGLALEDDGGLMKAPDVAD